MGKRTLFAGVGALALMLATSPAMAQPVGQPVQAPTTNAPPVATAPATDTLGQSTREASPPAAETPRPQPRVPEAEAAQVEEVVVTGSLIRGTPTDAALPVDVVSADEIAKQGSPSLVDVIKSIPAMGAVLGESNQFGSAQSTGTGNVNLRGLGAARTLVLLNGRRLTNSPNGNGVDTNLLPIGAIGRIEVLKDGAAATYGSDAIGGVVNFITRNDLNGFDINVAHQFVPGSDGESSVSANWGHKSSKWDALVSLNFRHRSALSTLDRDWAINPLDRNPGGSYSTFGNPGVFATGPTIANRFVDPGCEALSGPLRGTAAAPACYFQFGKFNNLIEEEFHYQAYAQANYAINDRHKLHFEAMYSSHDVPREQSSPSYAPVQNPPDSINGPAPAGQFFIPSSNPGLAALLPLLPAAQQAQIAASGGAYTLGLLFRPLGAGGNPLFDNDVKAKEDKRFFEAYRVSGGIRGEITPDWGYDVNLTYMDNRGHLATPDILLSRLQYALRGLGGFGCNPATGVPGAGPCQYFNPFSNGYAVNAADGRGSPLYVPGSAAAAANNPAIVDYLFESYDYKPQTTLFVLDAVVDGKLPWITLPGGPISVGAGFQYREGTAQRTTNVFTDAARSPCPIEGDTTCTTATGRGNGPFTFFAPLSNYNLPSDVKALFAEIQAPITDKLQLQIAGRYESFSFGDDTFNPKVALRWQIVPELALRVSAGTTFRAPPETSLAPGQTTTLTFRAEAGGYRPTDTFGNANLQPEEATTVNAGIIFKKWGLNASLDYFNFDFQKPLTTEPAGNMLATLIASGCNLPAAFLARFTTTNGVPFGPGACSGANLARIRSTNINGSYIKTSGLDFAATYDFPRQLWGGDLRFGLDGTYNIDYRTGEQFVEGVLVRGAYDFAGTLGTGPQLRGNLYGEYNQGRHNLRVTVRYIGDQLDTRNGQFGAGNIFTAVSPEGQRIGEFVTGDVAYRVRLPYDTILTAVLANVTDEAPPFARLDLSYDPFTANPYGRTFKLSFQKRF